MHTILPRQTLAAERENDVGATTANTETATAAPAMLPPAPLRYAPAPVPRNEAAGGITEAENDAVRRLSANRVDLHAMGATVQRVPAGDPRLRAVGARSLTQGTQALLGHDADRGHELWHMAQQAMGRVKATEQVAGRPVNAELTLEREADRMGALIHRHIGPSFTTATAPWQAARLDAAPPIQRQVSAFEATTVDTTPPAADLMEKLDYDCFEGEEEDIKETIKDYLSFTEDGKIKQPTSIKATIEKNIDGGRPLPRKSGDSTNIGHIGTDNYLIHSGTYEVFEGGHIIAHKFWTDDDEDSDSADDYVNLAPMSRTMNVGKFTETWGDQESKMSDFLTEKRDMEDEDEDEDERKLDISVTLDTKYTKTYTYGHISDVFDLTLKDGSEAETVKISNWIPRSIKIEEGSGQIKSETSRENEIFNIHDEINDRDELINVLKKTPIWNRCTTAVKDALNDLDVAEMEVE